MNRTIKFIGKAYTMNSGYMDLSLRLKRIDMLSAYEFKVLA